MGGGGGGGEGGRGDRTHIYLYLLCTYVHAYVHTCMLEAAAGYHSSGERRLEKKDDQPCPNSGPTL